MQYVSPGTPELTRIRLIEGEHVTTEAGTGAVHTAPDHGVDDLAIAAAIFEQPDPVAALKELKELV